MADETKPLKPLILHIEVEGFYADDLDEMAGYVREQGTVTPEDRLYVVTEEWMRPVIDQGEAPPLHNLLICSGPVCVRGCPNHRWAQRNDLIGKLHQRYEGGDDQ